MPTEQTDRVLRRPEVERISGYCERALRAMERGGRFPKRFLLDPNGRAVGWLESEVLAWVHKRAQTREVSSTYRHRDAEKRRAYMREYMQQRRHGVRPIT